MSTRCFPRAVHRLGLGALLLALPWLPVGCASRVASPSPAPATDGTSAEALVEAMGQRLALMPQVAAWKRAHDQPVRDRPREQKVLEDAVRAVEAAAERIGVKPFPENAVRELFQAQIDAAVEIQEQIVSKPPTRRARAIPDLETVIRPQLDRLGRRIADLLVTQREPLDRSRLERLAHKHWRVEGLEPDTINRLIDALEKLLATTTSGSLTGSRVSSGALQRPRSRLIPTIRPRFLSS